MKTVLENLQMARDLLARENGFVQGMLWKQRGNVEACCALGALIRANQAITKGVKWAYGVANQCSPEVVALASCLPNEAKERMANGGIHDPHHDTTAYAHSDAARKVVTFNNTSDQQTVVAWFDRAIAIQKEHPTEKVG